MTAAPSRTLRLGRRRYPVVFPDARDPRLLIAMVVFSVLAIGITALDFAVSIPQILAAVLTGVAIDGTLTFRRTGRLEWPASGVNTASGVALIMRVVGTESGDLWSWRGWHVYVLVTAFALFTKHVIQYRGAHVFNPSNVALVLAFLLLGSGRLEPLDFWWAPFGVRMVVVYAIILTGGILVLRGLRLLVVPFAFWLVLVAGLGVLAGSGHCFTAPWSFQPVCGPDFWWVVITSPEMLFFIFFMITDPKTIPSGPAARVVFAVLVGVVAVLLMAPQATEFGAKVGLLASVAIVSPLRWLIDGWFRDVQPRQTRIAEFVDRLATSSGVQAGRPVVFLRGVVGGAVVAGIAMLIIVFGAPARDAALAFPVAEPAAVAVTIDPATLPTITHEDDPMLGGIEADAIALMLAENLEIEAEAMIRGESEALLAADFGSRLEEMQGKMARFIASGEWTVPTHAFDSLHLRIVPAFGGQGMDLAFDATGTIREITYDADREVLATESRSFATTFVLRQATDDRWLILEATDMP